MPNEACTMHPLAGVFAVAAMPRKENACIAKAGDLKHNPAALVGGILPEADVQGLAGGRLGPERERRSHLFVDWDFVEGGFSDFGPELGLYEEAFWLKPSGLGPRARRSRSPVRCGAL